MPLNESSKQEYNLNNQIQTNGKNVTPAFLHSSDP